PSPLPSSDADIAKRFLETYEPPIPESHVQALRFAAICSEPIPGALLKKMFAESTVTSLVDEYNLLIKTGAGSYVLPEVLRKYLQNSTQSPMELHKQAFNGFLELAEADENAQEEAKFQLVTRWYREAFRHRLDMTKLQQQHDVEDAV